MKRFFRFLLYNRTFSTVSFILVTVVTLVLTLIPGDSLSHSSIWNYDKLGHALMFGSWAPLLIQISKKYSPIYRPGWYDYLFAGTGALIFGGVIELLQLILPIMRTASWADFLADAVGIIVFSLIHALLIRLIRSGA
jgi:VanZ family protein